MRSFLIPAVFISSALCFGPVLIAAPQQAPYNYGARNNGQSPTPGVSDFRAGQMLFSSVRADLDRAEANLPEYSPDRYRFDRVRGELSELQREWDESAYTPSQADHVIRALDRALTSNDVLGGDRQQLQSDVDQLRLFRDDHE